MSGPFILAFGLWMLLSADFSWANALVGLFAAALASLLPRHRFSAWQLARLVLSTFIRIPLALWEAFEIVFQRYPCERISTCKVCRPENRWAVFCQTFIITFTPRTLVIAEKDGEMMVHSLERKETP